jgi:hypothetical protein
MSWFPCTSGTFSEREKGKNPTRYVQESSQAKKGHAPDGRKVRQGNRFKARFRTFGDAVRLKWAETNIPAIEAAISFRHDAMPTTRSAPHDSR